MVIIHNRMFQEILVRFELLLALRVCVFSDFLAMFTGDDEEWCGG